MPSQQRSPPVPIANCSKDANPMDASGRTWPGQRARILETSLQISTQFKPRLERTLIKVTKLLAGLRPLHFQCSPWRPAALCSLLGRSWQTRGVGCDARCFHRALALLRSREWRRRRRRDGRRGRRPQGWQQAASSSAARRPWQQQQQTRRPPRWWLSWHPWNRPLRGCCQRCSGQCCRWHRCS